MTGGRPLRFLLLVMGSWVGARAVLLWPVPLAVAGDALVPKAVADPAPSAPMPSVLLPRVKPYRPMRALPFRLAPGDDESFRPTRRPSAVLPNGTSQNGSGVAAEQSTEAQPGIVAGLPIPRPIGATERRSRFFGSAWAVARDGNGPAGGVPGVQLGGSQAGLRLGYALRDDRRLALVGRIASPLGRGMRELALGIEWQPTRLPVRLVAEQRFALNTGKGGPTLAAVGGIGPVPIAAGFRLEAYAQGGVIARDGHEGFADGAVRLARPIASVGSVRFDLGGGAWGAAQKGARRVDVGPSLSATLPIGPQPVRLSLDWRQRVAGNASPGSGLVVTLGADF